MKKHSIATGAAVLLSAWMLAAPALAATKYALCVGINKYTRKGIADLTGCVNDASYFHANLVNRGGWKAGNAVKLLDGKATKAAIRGAISDFASKAVPGDTFVYMHSSHGGNNGEYVYTKSVFLCSTDDFYEDTELAEDLAKFQAGVNVVVIVDACHSSGLFLKSAAKKSGAKAAGPRQAFDLAGRVSSLMDAMPAKKSAAGGARAARGNLSSAEIGWVTAARYDEEATDGGYYDSSEWLTSSSASGKVKGGLFLCAFTWGWWSGTADRTGVGDGDGLLDGYEGWKYARSVCADEDQTPQCHNAEVLRRVELGRIDMKAALAFDANGGKCKMKRKAVTVGGPAGTLPTATRSGWKFLGWYTKKTGGRRCTVSTTVDSALKLYAHWARTTYTVAFKPNGGKGRMAKQVFTYGKAARLRKNAFTRKGYVFRGWSKTRKGGVQYRNRQAVKNLRKDGGTTALYAVWRRPAPTLPAAVDASLTFATGGDAKWRGQTAVSHDGADAARSGKIGDNQASWMQTAVTGPGTVSFWWKVSCEGAPDNPHWYDYMDFRVDGVRKARIKGSKGGWTKVTVEVAGGGRHVLRWTYRKDWLVSIGSDCGWVDQVQWKASKAAPAGKTAAKTAASTAAPAKAVPAAKKPANGVFAVTAIDGEDASAVADGDEKTAWTTDAANGAWVVLTLTEPRTVEDVEVLGEALPDGTRILLSEDADKWKEEVPAKAQYVWVVFPGCGAPLTVKEIRVLPGK
jgi:uncharacterized repeat protein (TIGR02543 family)